MGHGNSTYQNNLNNLLSTLPSTIDPYGYSNSSFGQVPDRANAVVLCRGDADPGSCRSCVNDSVSTLPGLCPGNKEAVGWFDLCMVRYSSMPLTGNASISTDQTLYVWNPRNATSPEKFNEDVNSLLEDLKPRAATGGTRLKFAAGKKDGPDFQTIYAIVQCAPDLSEEQCGDCLNRAFSLYPSCCNGRVGGRVITPNCNFRYEIDAFYNETNVQTSTFFPSRSPSPSPSPPLLQLAPPPSGNGNRKKGVSVSSFLFLILLLTI